jgi:ABC-type branched-subunit amino acid transport system substrate-binding protein
MADTPEKPLAGDFAKAALVIYAPDAASQKAAQAAKDLIEKNGGKVEVRNQNPPYSYPGIH